MVKLASNVATIPLFFILEAVLPRALGPANYGNYNFATLLFYQLITFLDMGTPTCLSTTVAKRPQEFGLVAFYARVALVILGLTLLAGGIMLLPPFGDWLMPGVPVWLALPAALWAYLTWLGRVIRSVNDALGITTSSELVRIAVNVTSALVLLGLFFAGWLNITLVFSHQYATLALLCVGFAATLRNAWKPRQWGLSRPQTAAYSKEFWRYSGPLFTMMLVSAIAVSGERWILQFFDGSVGQGYFSLSQKISMGCFLFVTAMTPLLMRELAVAHGRNDPREMGRLLDRLAPMIYAVAAWFSCFTTIEAVPVVRLFGGAAFADALLPVQIMTLYAMHQGYGQVAGAVFYASGNTKVLRNVTVVGLAAGLATAFFLMAPPAWGGLSLGATGLAIKMVGVQFITVNVLLFLCKRVAPFNYGRNIVHQILCPACFLGLALACRSGTLAALAGQEDGFARFFLSGVVYTALTGILVLAWPFLIGLQRDDLRRLWHKAKAFAGR